MDVITILQPENHLSRPRLASRSRPANEPAAAARNYFPESREPGRAPSVVDSLGLTEPPFSAADLRELPAPLSFPVLLLLVAVFSLGVTPFVQEKIGFYRLDRFDFPQDSQAEASMRILVAPDPDASLVPDDGAALAAELPASIRSVSYKTYTVRKGDTVGSIASRFGLRNISTILSVNGIDNARRIRSGLVLNIPSMDGILHTVSRGDSLNRIASRYSVRINTLLDANDLSVATLSAGQHLFIPGATLSTMDLRKALGELFMTPVRGRLTSRFGFRSDPFTGARTFHTGIDLAAPTGTPIKATLDGKVATSGYSTVFGNYVIITHDGGYQSLYGHMSQVAVKRGQRLVQGDLVGRVGSTGYSTGSHLHFSVYKNGKMIDPYSVLK